MSGPTKGMVAGQPIKTGEVTKEFEEGYERTFGKPKGDLPKGRRFRWDPALQKLVPAGLVEERRAVDASVLAGRFYENTKSPIDGSDIGSRRRHQDHMKLHNVTISSDFSGAWHRAAKEREAIRAGTHDKKERREQLERALYQIHKP